MMKTELWPLDLGSGVQEGNLQEGVSRMWESRGRACGFVRARPGAEGLGWKRGLFSVLLSSLLFFFFNMGDYERDQKRGRHRKGWFEENDGLQGNGTCNLGRNRGLGPGRSPSSLSVRKALGTGECTGEFADVEQAAEGHLSSWPQFSLNEEAHGLVRGQGSYVMKMETQG